MWSINIYFLLLTAWKVSKYGVFSGPYFTVFGLGNTPHLDTFHAVYFLYELIDMFAFIEHVFTGTNYEKSRFLL